MGSFSSAAHLKLRLPAFSKLAVNVCETLKCVLQSSCGVDVLAFSVLLFTLQKNWHQAEHDSVGIPLPAFP